jgi:hypothetical protein
MRLRNPGGIDNAIKAVDEVRSQLDNASNRANSAPERQSAFLSWCDNWATPQLGNHFPESEGIFGEVSESYHRIVALPALANPQLNGMMHREFKGWDAKLQRVTADLWQMREVLARPGKLVVLDTFGADGRRVLH